ncbi:MAG: hypothetical protein K2N56_05355 [Oscillospiraceae bacterium]|nr:hypothetical protein [Oscillospiraceae bacterium]
MAELWYNKDIKTIALPTEYFRDTHHRPKISASRSLGVSRHSTDICAAVDNVPVP